MTKFEYLTEWEIAALQEALEAVADRLEPRSYAGLANKLTAASRIRVSYTQSLPTKKR